MDPMVLINKAKVSSKLEKGYFTDLLTSYKEFLRHIASFEIRASIICKKGSLLIGSWGK